MSRGARIPRRTNAAGILECWCAPCEKWHERTSANYQRNTAAPDGMQTWCKSRMNRIKPREHAPAVLIPMRSPVATARREPFTAPALADPTPLLRSIVADTGKPPAYLAKPSDPTALARFEREIAERWRYLHKSAVAAMQAICADLMHA